jgi:hypothetical protein
VNVCMCLPYNAFVYRVFSAFFLRVLPLLSQLVFCSLDNDACCTGSGCLRSPHSVLLPAHVSTRQRVGKDKAAGSVVGFMWTEVVHTAVSGPVIRR